VLKQENQALGIVTKLIGTRTSDDTR